MALTPSTMLELGTEAPDFALVDTQGREVKRDDFRGTSALVVIFMCNHCPYVKHINHAFASLARDFQVRNVAFVGISSNDVENYPEDSPAKMSEEAARVGYTFPYLYDETQEVAKVYRAACTPDLYVFDKSFKLVYRGQFDASRPGNDQPVTGVDLRNALEAVLADVPCAAEQKPSIGCNIKWKPGNAPEYFG